MGNLEITERGPSMRAAERRIRTAGRNQRNPGGPSRRELLGPAEVGYPKITGDLPHAERFPHSFRCVVRVALDLEIPKAKAAPAEPG